MMNAVVIKKYITYSNLANKTSQPFNPKVAKELSRVVFHSIA